MNTQATPPTATATSENRASVCIFMAVVSPRRLAGRLGGVERGRESLLFAVVARAIPELRPADAGRFVPADQVAVGILAGQLIDEQVLRDDHVAFHPRHLGDVGD